MSDIVLAPKYSPERYKEALDELTKLYDDEPINYSKVSQKNGGPVSEQQAQTSLKFFKDIELIEAPTQGDYKPSENVITWRQAVKGQAKSSAKQKISERLLKYRVFEKTCEYLLEPNLSDFTKFGL